MTGTGPAMGSVMGVTEFAETWQAEDPILLAARRRAGEIGVSPVSAASGAVLRLLATSVGARSVVETGTGTGVSGLWLLRGMRPDGVLTSIDREPEHQRVARATFSEAGVPNARARLIAGSALDVLPRLTDAAYDLVHLDAAPAELADQLREALRLLRPGGLVAVSHATWHGRVPDPADRDPDTMALRAFGTLVREDPSLVSALVPCADGLLLAARPVS